MASGKVRNFRQDELSRVKMDKALRESGGGMAAHHCHSYYELYYVEQGGCRFMIDDSFYDLNTDDFILLPPQTFHYTHYLQDRCLRSNLYFRSVDISEPVRAALPENGGFFSHARIFHAQAPYHDQICELLDRMEEEETLNDARTASMQYFLLQELFLLIARACDYAQPLPEVIRASDRQILLAARYISSKYMNPISSGDIAAAAGFSPNHLSKKFRESAGIGVHEYLVFIRLQHAALELISTRDSITQIALRCGFSDSNYFKDVFKKKYGMTPREYRKSR